MKYQLIARFFPSIIAAIPALLFQYFFLNPEIENFVQYMGSLKFVGDITISIVILYFFSQTNRLIAKSFFEKSETFLPTTDFLFFSNSEYSPDYKALIYNKIQDEFSLQLPSKEEQIADEINSRKRISEAISLVRKKVGSGTLLLQHNIEYGFWRNLIGGAIIASIFSIIDIYFALAHYNYEILILSAALLVIYLILLIFHNSILGKIAKLYARVLFQEYMTHQ